MVDIQALEEKLQTIRQQRDELTRHIRRLKGHILWCRQCNEVSEKVKSVSQEVIDRNAKKENRRYDKMLTNTLSNIGTQTHRILCGGKMIQR